MDKKSVWKYTLNSQFEVDGPGRSFEFEIPKGAEVLDVQMQGDDPRIWAIVDPSDEKETRRFVVFGTGHEISSDLDLEYVGTVQMYSGGLIFHVFEVNQ